VPYDGRDVRLEQCAGATVQGAHRPGRRGLTRATP
jgi:hypothetical protein